MDGDSRQVRTPPAFSHHAATATARSCPHGLTVRTKNQNIIWIAVHEVVDDFFVIATEDLFKIILAHVSIALKILNQ